MNPNKKQYKTLNNFLKNNDSFIWGGKFGWYSDGSFTIEGYWSFDEFKQICKLTINTDGKNY